MIRKVFQAAVIVTALSSGSWIGCSSDSAPSSSKGDGAAGAAAGAAGTPGPDGAAGSSESGGAGGRSSDGSSGAGNCGDVFGRTAACKSCLEAHCCDRGTACGNDPNCPKLAQCIRDCDAMAGSKATDQCHTDCNSKYLTATSGPVYNGVVTCMGQSCLSECPFLGP